MKKKKIMVRLWGDHIVISSLFIGLLISISLVGLTFGIINLLALYYPSIAANKKDLIYIFGTVAVLIGFVINNFWIKPQRNIITKKESKDEEVK